MRAATFAPAVAAILALSAAPAIALAVTVDGTSRNDTLKGSSNSDTIKSYDGNDVIYGYGSSDSLYGGRGDDKIYGSSGNDKIYGWYGSNYMDGASGDDTITVTGEKLFDYTYRFNTILGGTGSDTIDIRGENINVKAYGDDGSDEINFVSDRGGGEVHGGDDGDDIYIANTGGLIYGDSGADTISVNGETSYKVYGGSNGDKITLHNDGSTYGYGGTGSDYIVTRLDGIMFGEDGDDVLESQEPAGYAQMTGGPGSDHFSCNGQYDSVKDYKPSEGDTIEGSCDEINGSTGTAGSDWAGFAIESVGNAGQDSAIAIGPDGTIHIAYYDAAHGNLKYAKITQPGSWSTTTVDSTDDNVGIEPSIAIDSVGRPHISYYDATNHNLKYARQTEPSGLSGWTIGTVVSSGDVGLASSIDLDSDDRPHISYLDRTISEHAIKYAKQVSGGITSAGTWSFKTIDSSARYASSLALDGNDRPRIIYEEVSPESITTPDGLNYARVTSSGSWLIDKVVADEYDLDPSIATDSDGRTHFTYMECCSNGYGKLDYAHRDADGEWQFEEVDARGGSDSSLKLDSEDIPHIIYAEGRDTGSNLKYATFEDGAWQTEVIYAKAGSGSLALDEDDVPHVSYDQRIVVDPQLDKTNSHLVYAYKQ